MFAEIIIRRGREMKKSVAAMGVLVLLGAFACGASAEEKAAAPATQAVAPATEQPKADAPKVEEPKVTGSVGFGVFSQYIFRGYELSRRSAVVQPTISASYRGFSANLWGNWDSRQSATQSFLPGRDGRDEGQKAFNETDVTLSYTRNFGPVGVTLGYIYYGTEYAKQTQELFASLTYDIFAHPTLTVNQDIDSYRGTYFNLSFSQSFPVYKIATGDVTLDLGAGFGFFIGESNYWKTFDSSTGGYTGSKYTAAHDGNVKAGVTIPLGKNITVQPVVQYWFPLSGDAHRTVDGNSYNYNGKLDQTVVFGLNMAMSF
jgi:hypothetical protein